MSIASSKEEFYNDIWDNADECVKLFPATRHRRKFIIDQIKKIDNWQSVADFGCGNAMLIKSIYDEFADNNKEFYGLDVSPGQIERNKDIYPAIGFEALDFSDRACHHKFDIITCSEVIEHIPRYEDSIRNIVDSLNPGGHAIITVPTAEIFYTEQTIGHVKHFLKDEIASYFEKYGLETKLVKTWGFPFHDFSKIVANINPKWSLGTFHRHRLSWSQKLTFQLMHLSFFLNILPMGKQLFYIGQKPE